MPRRHFCRLHAAAVLMPAPMRQPLCRDVLRQKSLHYARVCSRRAKMFRYFARLITLRCYLDALCFRRRAMPMPYDER